MNEPAAYVVKVSLEAQNDLVNLKAYIINQGSPKAAQHQAERIERIIVKLEHYPGRGRHKGGGVREMVLIRPYIIRYRIRGQTVEVLRVRHGAMQPK